MQLEINIRKRQVFQSSASAHYICIWRFECDYTTNPMMVWRCRGEGKLFAFPKHSDTHTHVQPAVRLSVPYVTLTDGCALAFSLRFLMLTLVLPFHSQWACTWVKMNLNINTNSHSIEKNECKYDFIIWFILAAVCIRLDSSCKLIDKWVSVCWCTEIANGVPLIMRIYTKHQSHSQLTWNML